jgi:4-aminobutyrate aminotransferase/(S)-3-amino-2-methylpropionate transaminase
VYRVPFAYCYRCSYSLKYPECGVYCAQHLEDTFKRVVAAESVAAVIAEPVLGEGGFVTPPPEFFRILVETCRKYGILFIADEVQTGFGRTGAMFACERYGIEPDLLVTAKSLGGGLPLGAVTGRVDIMDAAAEGGLGGTFGGNPVCVEAGLAVLDALQQEGLAARAEELGSRFAARARRWQKQWPQIGEVRGLGGMQAMELVRSPATREPASEETKEIVRYCYQHGLIVLSAGSYGNVIRLLMPLVMSDDQFEEALGVLEAALAAVLQSRGIAVQTA